MARSQVRVAVELAAVRVDDRLRAARPVERAPADGRHDVPIGRDVMVAVDPAVAGLDLRDAGQDRSNRPRTSSVTLGAAPAAVR